MAKQTTLSSFLVFSTSGSRATTSSTTSGDVADNHPSTSGNVCSHQSTSDIDVSVNDPSTSSASPNPANLAELTGHRFSLLELTIAHSKKPSDSEKHHMLTTLQADILDCQFDTRYFFVGASRKRKQITFQRRWLRYVQEESHRGGWCLPCFVFLTDLEKTSLGAFVKTAFVKYNKSKELLAGHLIKQYHLTAMERASKFIANFLNPEGRIDSSLAEAGSKNFQFNSKILPTIVEAVIFCARQRIALQGSHQDKVDYSSEPTQNQGNFVAVLRLLDSTLDGHFKHGARNALYTSKTVQNEVLQIAADQIREFCRNCLVKCPYFSILADKVTSNGKEILSVCLRFLEVNSTSYQVKPKKHEVLLDFEFLQRITGESISKSILEVLEIHRIDVKCCRGRAYDTTSSMSSTNTGVQAHIKKIAPDADYQGCCLHSLNLVICKASTITYVRNMFDSCQQAFLFFQKGSVFSSL